MQDARLNFDSRSSKMRQKKTHKTFKTLSFCLYTPTRQRVTAPDITQQYFKFRRTTMQKVIRLIVMLFMVVASLAAFSTPTPKSSVVYAEGGAPMPLCDPGVPCEGGPARK